MIEIALDEQPDNIGCKGFKDGNAHSGTADTGDAGTAGDVLHALVIPRGIVVGHQRHHALCQTHADVQREHIDLLDDAESSHRNITVSRRKVVDGDIGKAGKEGGNGRGQSHRQHLTGKAEPWGRYTGETESTVDLRSRKNWTAK